MRQSEYSWLSHLKSWAESSFFPVCVTERFFFFGGGGGLGGVANVATAPSKMNPHKWPGKLTFRSQPCIALRLYEINPSRCLTDSKSWSPPHTHTNTLTHTHALLSNVRCVAADNIYNNSPVYFAPERPQWCQHQSPLEGLVSATHLCPVDSHITCIISLFQRCSLHWLISLFTVSGQRSGTGVEWLPHRLAMMGVYT